VTAYTLLLLVGIGVSALTWKRLATSDRRLPWIYAAALVSALAGAKLAFFVAEGWAWWNQPERWIVLLTGKSILGALLGGYLGVECAKRWTGYTKPTGDLFAVIVPIGIVIGRFGCLMQGCCPGVVMEVSWFTTLTPDGFYRWPAVPAEILFNLLAILGFAVLRAGHWLTGQHFHVYLMAAGLFRFFHEFFRDTPRIVGGWSGYQFLSLAVFAVGAIGYWRRSRAGAL
jgi:phosphatidylglycerol:prolipoprotein diacylglycerol transferase